MSQMMNSPVTLSSLLKSPWQSYQGTLVVIFFLRSRTLTQHIVNAPILESTPEAVRMVIAEVCQHKSKTVVSLVGIETKERKRKSQIPDKRELGDYNWD